MTRRVAIIGGGFGGLAAARRLGRRDARNAVQVTLIDRSNHHTFQPLLYQVATAALAPQDVGHSLRAALHDRPNLRFRLGTVTSVDWAARRLLLADGGAHDFDDLIIAAGAVPADFGVPGVADHAFPLKGLRDAVTLRNHILARYEQASARPSSVDDGALTFVIAGGGPTGVEVAGALRELVNHVVAKDFPDVDVARTRIVLVELGDALLGGFSAPSQRYAHAQLQLRGVEVRLGVGVAKVTADSIHLGDGTLLPAATLVWAAGVRANPLAQVLGLEVTRAGRLVVGDDLRVPGHSDVYAVGDVAAIPHPRARVAPQLAPVALQSGRHAAEQILRRVARTPPTTFRYVDKGVMATIGRNAAVAELPLGLRLRGLPAWAAWLLLHLLFLIGFRNRASVLLQWAWSYVTYDRSARVVFDDIELPAGGAEATSRRADRPPS